jgi:arginase family enzyme
LPKLIPSTPFCGLPQAALDDFPEGVHAAVIGAGSSLGSAHPGSENGPYFLRTASRALTWGPGDPQIFDLRHRRQPLAGAVDLGDLDFTGLGLSESHAAIRSAVAALPPGVVPCVIGGDHSITLPIVEALTENRDEPLWVVQFDHHLDLQIWEGAPSDPDTARDPIFNTNVMSHVSDQIGAGRLIQVGVSPYATVEAADAPAMAGFLDRIGTQLCLSSRELQDPELFRSAVGSGRDVHLSIDIDVLHRNEMSSTGYPAETGLSSQDLLRLLDLVLAGNRLVGLDLVEFAAARGDRDEKTVSDASRAVLILLHVLSRLSAQRSARTEGDTAPGKTPSTRRSDAQLGHAPKRSLP